MGSASSDATEHSLTSIAYWEQLFREDIGPMLLSFGLKLLTAIVVFIVGRWVARRLVKVVDRLLQRSNVDELLRRFLCRVLGALLTAVVAIFALERLGIETTAAVAILGAAGLAVGFALKDSLGNFASGVMVLIFRPYKVGDFVTAGGVSGSVEEVQTFSTIMRTPDGKRVIIPNGKITSDVITNFTDTELRRIDLEIGIDYGDDFEKAKTVLRDICNGLEAIVSEPAPDIRLKALGDNSVNLVCRPWVKPSDYWPTYFALMEAIKSRFDQEGLSFPFPQRDVHLHQVA